MIEKEEELSVKEQTLRYLKLKQNLTVNVQNARHELSVVENDYLQLKKTFRKYFLLMIFVAPILMTLIFHAVIGQLISWIGIIVLIVLRVKKGNQAKKNIQMALHHLNIEENETEYLNGMNDFPSKFYSYWTIDRLMNLIKENRATTLQEAFNIAENQDFQNDQLALQQQNLDVAKSTNTMASISAAANIGTFLNTRKK